MSAESDALARIAAGLGPSRWHPLQRRRWRKLLAFTSVGAYWTDHAEVERVWFAENVLPMADVFAAELSKELPDGYSVAFDVATFAPSDLTVIPSSGIPVQRRLEP